MTSQPARSTAALRRPKSRRIQESWRLGVASGPVTGTPPPSRGSGLFDHARGAGGGHGGQRREPSTLRPPQPRGGHARLLPRTPGLGIEPLGEIDEVGETMLLVRIDLDFLVEAIDERGQPRLLAAFAWHAREQTGVGGAAAKGSQAAENGSMAAPRAEDTDESQRGEGTARSSERRPGPRAARASVSCPIAVAMVSAPSVRAQYSLSPGACGTNAAGAMLAHRDRDNDREAGRVVSVHGRRPVPPARRGL